ncbi:MAG: FMN-binding protein [Eubacteriales bacterium]
MKKLIICILVLVVFILPGCGKEADDNEYVDGTYTAEGDPWDHGNEDASVVIEDGKITDITLRRLDTDGNDVTENYTGQEEDGKQYPDLMQAREDMIDDMLDEQTYNVDTIAGATITADNWKLAVQRALEGASGEE